MITQEMYKDYFSLSKEDREKILTSSVEDIEEFMDKMRNDTDMTEIEILTSIIISLEQVREFALEEEEYEKLDLIDKIKDKLIKHASTNKK